MNNINLNSNVSIFDCTVVVTCHNSERTIRHTLNSISSQNPTKAKEVIIVDDASSDMSRYIIKEFPYKNIFLDNNVGAGAAKMIGFKEAKTKYVTFLDSDDSWNPNFLDLQSKAWNLADSEMAAIGFGLTLEEGKGDKSFRFRNSHILNKSKLIEFDDLWKSNPFTNSALVYATEKLTKIGGYYHESPVDDFGTVSSLFLSGFKLMLNPIKVGIYGISDNQITKNVDYQLEGQLRIYKLLSTFFPKDMAQYEMKKKARQLWFRSIAKCANYGLTSSQIPKIPKYCSDNYVLIVFNRLIQTSFCWNIAKFSWRLFTSLRFHLFQLILAGKRLHLILINVANPSRYNV